MPRTRPYARIAITLPPADLRAADRLAKQLDRSRSWVFAEALRRFVEDEAAAREGTRLDRSRRAQLARDLRLTPADRVRFAEAGAELARRAADVPGDAPLAFPSHAAFRAWRKQSGLE